MKSNVSQHVRRFVAICHVWFSTEKFAYKYFFVVWLQQCVHTQTLVLYMWTYTHGHHVWLVSFLHCVEQYSSYLVLFWSICCSPVWVEIKQIFSIFSVYYIKVLYAKKVFDWDSTMLSITDFWITCISIPPLQLKALVVFNRSDTTFKWCFFFFFYLISLLILNIVHHFFKMAWSYHFKSPSKQLPSLPPAQNKYIALKHIAHNEKVFSCFNALLQLVFIILWMKEVI